MAKTILYVYMIGNEFVKISSTTLRCSKAKTIEEAAYWTKKSYALGWKSQVCHKYPQAKLKPATIKLL